MKDSKSLKIISYAIIPILVLNIIILAFSLVYYEEYTEDVTKSTTYFETEQFTNDLLSSLRIGRYRTSTITYEEEIEEDDVTTTEDKTLELTQNKQDINYETSYRKTYEYLIIDKDNNKYTNIDKTIHTDTIEELKEYIKAKKYFWTYENKEVNTNIESMKYDNIVYNSYFENIKESECKAVYVCVANENNAQLYRYNLAYTIVSNTYEYAPLNITISVLILVAAFVYILITIGHKKDVAGIYTNKLDKIPLEIVSIVAIILVSIEIMILYILTKEVFASYSLSIGMIRAGILICILLGVIIYATLATTGVTIIRRIKAKMFWKNTLIYKIFKWIKVNTTEMLFKNTEPTRKAILYVSIFIIVQFMLFVMAITYENVLCLIGIIALWFIGFKKILENLKAIDKIKKKISDIYNGNTNEEKLQVEEFKGELKEVAEELNDISGGFSNAIEEAMKSERLKTELITNVSHDIKTPLTSIINYVDLMKKEDIDNEQVKEYLEVLDNKSQRLKKLTEDLVEASKASSGNIKLNVEKLNIKELITQVSAEFKDKFEKRGLEIIENIPQEELYINADSRYMYRILENVYVNISKYALENSRVYIDVLKEREKVKIVLKNISKDKLNISVDELMQRFVRGDSSRTTEGSGLGISIASSLTELQKGTFEIYLDGDLFKVVIEFKVVE